MSDVQYYIAHTIPRQSKTQRTLNCNEAVRIHINYKRAAAAFKLVNLVTTFTITLTRFIGGQRIATAAGKTLTSHCLFLVLRHSSSLKLSSQTRSFVVNPLHATLPSSHATQRYVFITTAMSNQTRIALVELRRHSFHR